MLAGPHREEGHDLLADEQVVTGARKRVHPDRLATDPIREPILPSRAPGHPALVLLTVIEKSPRTILRAI